MPAMVMAAPVILSQVKVSPRVSQATRPAIGGVRYANGAERAIPRTLFTQVHISQPKKFAPITPHTMPIHTVAGRCAIGAEANGTAVNTTMSGAEKNRV